jgi:hypothetical protein
MSVPTSLGSGGNVRSISLAARVDSGFPVGVASVVRRPPSDIAASAIAATAAVKETRNTSPPIARFTAHRRVQANASHETTAYAALVAKTDPAVA